MRAPTATAIVLAGLAGLAGLAVSAAAAADLPTDGIAGYSTRGIGAGYRSGQIALYDFQPGVVVRSYWRAPWRHRHYFPVTGTMPGIGRDEDLSVTGDTPEPAETFQRSWSTSSAVEEPPRYRLPQFKQPTTPPLK